MRLLVAGSALRGGRAALYALLWVALAAVLPFTGTPLDDGLDRFVVSAVSQIIAIGLCLWIVLRRPAGTVGRPADTLPTPFTPQATPA